MCASHLRRNEEHFIDLFQQFLQDKAFVCLGAKSALAHNNIEYYLANDIQTDSSDSEITEKLQSFAAKCSPDRLFVSFVVIFENTPILSEVDFEHYLWKRLQTIHEHDAQRYSWDSQVSSDPESPDYSMSIGGKGFYVVGLHPGSSRHARRFSRPALIFNLHSQFDLLREQGRFERLRECILKRDHENNGSINPMLASHGESSEAKQYSGRETDKDWKCPFKPQCKVLANDT